MRIKHGVRELWKGSKKEEEFVGTTLVVVHRPVRTGMRMHSYEQALSLRGDYKDYAD